MVQPTPHPAKCQCRPLMKTTMRSIPTGCTKWAEKRVITSGTSWPLHLLLSCCLLSSSPSSFTSTLLATASESSSRNTPTSGRKLQREGAKIRMIISRTHCVARREEERMWKMEDPWSFRSPRKQILIMIVGFLALHQERIDPWPPQSLLWTVRMNRRRLRTQFNCHFC